jgi:hypothetical protein
MYMAEMPAMSRVVRGGFPDRQFDVDFWQQQGDEASCGCSIAIKFSSSSAAGMPSMPS